ncbi:ribosome-binding factor A [Terrihabitans soli]|uniref:Ribosome-binding factor A n=1 Tax=Terrihabitans soli TaxID=708113 RepID=A0A6S6QK57_9HYPH|nr:30S ribosome-binding factor RbfA [Terrihabitans soli]BCJ89279.1 ribosome-binding factor A [Terrihabitans soli]
MIKKAQPAGPSQRQLRVGELVRHALAEILQRGEIPDPALGKAVITIPEVKMSPDLKLATAYVMPLGGKDADKIVKALAKNKAFLRGALGKRVELRSVPDLRFMVDTSFDIGAKMDALLDRPEVRRDVESKREGEE